VARLIVLDASVLIGALASDDVHHPAASAALIAAGDDDLVIAATTRAEVLVGPSRAGGTALEAAKGALDGCNTVPITTALADAAAHLRAHHRGLSLPDAIALAVADLIDADVVWTFDRRWASVDPRVAVP
jgi:predicted nucleic acid-binding protein